MRSIEIDIACFGKNSSVAEKCERFVVVVTDTDKWTCVYVLTEILRLKLSRNDVELAASIESVTRTQRNASVAGAGGVVHGHRQLGSVYAMK